MKRAESIGDLLPQAVPHSQTPKGVSFILPHQEHFHWLILPRRQREKRVQLLVENNSRTCLDLARSPSTVCHIDCTERGVSSSRLGGFAEYVTTTERTYCL
jgi:hypothetical protein